jgi:tetratricopeptide (TPR) repeat protein
VNIGLVAWALVLIKRKSIYAYGVLIYFISISIVSNFVFDIGAPMGERFLFQPSLGFAIAVGYGAHQFISFRKSLISVLAVLVILSGYKTISRNRDWKNDFTLFSRDIHAVPGSAKAHNNLAVALSDNSETAKDEKRKQMLEEALFHSKTAAAIYPLYLDAHLTMGLAYARLGDLAHATEAWEKAKEIQPASPVLQENMPYLSRLYLNEGLKLVGQDRSKAKEDLEKAIHYNPSNTLALYNLGGVFYMMGDINTAREYWKKTLQVDPSHKEAAAWLKKTGD